jgi:formylglycine-generating enzyme required for sulfatase activity
MSVRAAALFAVVGAAACGAGQDESPSAAPAVAARERPLTIGPSPIGQMTHIPEATYVMGSEHGDPDERPPHQVHVAAFDLDLTEVTAGEYAMCVKARACVPSPDTIQFPGAIAADHELYDSECNGDRPERRDHPINCVDWSMADRFCRWAGKRLPSEQEWEYAACAGDCNSAQGSRPTAAAEAKAGRWLFSSSVAMTPPGPFGLYDMAGNVWEWTASAYCPYDHPDCVDARRVVRGGAWSMVDFLFVRLTDRSPADPTNRNSNVGFRCARSSTGP